MIEMLKTLLDKYQAVWLLSAFFLAPILLIILEPIINTICYLINNKKSKDKIDDE